MIGVFYAFTGFFSPKATDEEKAGWASSGEAIAKFNPDGTAIVEDDNVDINSIETDAEQQK